MNIKDRVLEFISFKNIPISEFERRCELSNGYISSMRQGFGTKKLDNVLNTFPELNRDWLLYGEGEMLKKDELKSVEPQSGKLIPYYDAEVAAGTAYDVDITPARPTQMIEIGTLLREAEAAIRVYGNSMVPNYPAGCVIGTKLHIDSFIEPGTVYVIETRGGRYIKRLYYSEDKTLYECHSDNLMLYEEGSRKGKPYYPDFEIPISEVIRLHKVIGVIKRNIL